MKVVRQKRESGQGLIEYVLILILVAVALVAALNALGGGVIGAFYNNILTVL